MGRRGPAPIPSRLRVLRGETRPSQVNRGEPEPLPGLPVAPADLDPDALAIWERVLAEFGHTGVIRPADGDTLRLYAEAMARYTQSALLLRQSGPLIRGNRNGELVKNPLHQIVRDNALLGRSLAGELGLTPAARVGLRDIGDARPARTFLQDLRDDRRRRSAR